MHLYEHYVLFRKNIDFLFYLTRNSKYFYMVFINLEKVYGRVPRCGGLYIYKGDTRKNIKVKNMYGAIISVRRNGNFPNEFLSQ